ncbi:MAG TPA: PQQ-dependent sugar dehydrogenase [Thermoanaerobaculia bacterium]|nr:PQQ-dependent sugar dehydrogenase [Thermoanaerobaculia bacterium]
MKRGLLLMVLFALSASAQQVVLQPIATGLSSPVGLVNAGDSRMFIVEQTGRIVIYDGTHVLATPFLDVTSLISCCDERGLLGLAFDPHYASNGRLFIDYTDRNGSVTIARYNVSSDSNVADSSSANVLLSIDHTAFSNHNGGQLQFGPDGDLYIGVGDGGGGGDPLRTAPDPTKLLGKILRIDVSGSSYAIPPDNPFGNEVWAYGLRNPWRFSFDRSSGDLIIGDVGQDKWEEVDFQPAGTPGGRNYGWHCYEATHPYNPGDPLCQGATFTMPVLEYSHDGGACAIIGGYRYHGAKNPRLHDLYFYGDYCTGAIFAARQMSDGTWSSQQVTSIPDQNSLSSFGQDASGELYAVDLNGAIYRIVDTSAPPARRRAATH